MYVSERPRVNFLDHAFCDASPTVNALSYTMLEHQKLPGPREWYG